MDWVGIIKHMTDAIRDIEDLKAFLKKRTQETWDERKVPYYLSAAGVDLKNKGVDYRLFTKGKRLAQWAGENKITDTKFLAHPTIKAKVGLLPKEENFDLDTPPSLDKNGQSTSKKKEKLLIQFVRSLAQMPEIAVEKLNIPAEVLINLLDK